MTQTLQGLWGHLHSLKERWVVQKQPKQSKSHNHIGPRTKQKKDVCVVSVNVYIALCGKVPNFFMSLGREKWQNHGFCITRHMVKLVVKCCDVNVIQSFFIIDFPKL